ncbi:putative uncharacterized protein DDB_G0277255 [Mercenaria mercenaria]|uniref:putative uncharacterized protein DDB_G0277255 n=1 Tax=Mercenaria mercenaria TaxID=6596 RepID=UPI00234E90A5|nr:putative uncharacterized protein DDB_G0277255 [Mercenaria mercenaria]
MNRTYHLCNCPTCGSVNISCQSDSNVEWIGVLDFAFGILPNGTDCSSEAVSSFVIPKTGDKNVNCDQSYSTMVDVLRNLSGKMITKNNQNDYADGYKNIYVKDYCTSKTGYFIAKFDCVKHQYSNDLKIDNSCNYNKTLDALPISSESYPRGNISTNVGSCKCTLTTTASELVLRTYDNGLDANQTLTLSFANSSIIKQWRKAEKMEEVINTTYITGPFSSTQLLLNWENRAKMAKGKLWIVLQAVNGSITTICKQNTSTTSAPAATINGSVSTPSNTGNSNNSPTAPPNTSNASPTISQKSASLNSPSVHSNAATVNNSVSTPSNTRNSNNSPTAPPNTSNASPTISQKSTSLNSTSVHSNAATVSSTLTSNSRTMDVSSSSRSDSTSKSDQATTHPSSKNPEESSDEKGSTAAIIGGVVGGLIALILLILCCLCLCLKKNRKTEPEKNEQPANSKFKNENNAKGKPNDNHVGTAFENSAEVAAAASITRNTLPPLPSGRFLNNVQKTADQNSLDTSRRGHILPEAKSKQEASPSENGKLNDALYAHLIGDVPEENKFTSDDITPLTGPTVSSAGNMHSASITESRENDAADENGQKEKKKKKKRKKKRKWNTIGALLDEDATTEPEKIHDTEQFRTYDI